MKVGFFFQRADRKSVESLLREARRRGVPAVAYRFSSRWRELELDQFRHNFEDLTHLVISLTPEDLWEDWCAFIAGIALSRELSLLYGGPEREIPELFIGIKRFSEEGELFAHLEEMRLYHDRIGGIEQARSELIGEGLAITEQAMADAVGEGREDDVLRFMRIGFDANSCDSKGSPMLLIAIKNRRQKMVDLLLEHGADVNLVSQDRLTSPLMEAAVNGEEEIVDTLLDAGADLDLQSHNGQTALMMAISEGHRGVARKLLERGAKADQVDQLGMTSRKYAKLFKQEEITELLDQYAGETGS